MRSRGDPFTWVEERHSHTVKCCLDKAFIISAWSATFPNAEMEFLEFTGSDHRPILVHINDSFPQRQKLFRFDKRLLDIPIFKQTVHTNWKSTTTPHHMPITERIASCRRAMARLKHTSNMNSDERIKTLQGRLNRAMASTLEQNGGLFHISKKHCQRLIVMRRDTGNRKVATNG